MRTIEVVVMNYFGHPELYPYMPEEIFYSLQRAFLNREETVELPRDDFEHMLNEYNRCVYAKYKDRQEATASPHYYVLRNYQTSEN